MDKLLLLVFSLSTFSLFAEPQAIVGVWPLGDGSEKGTGAVFFFPDGHYLHMEDVEGEDPPGIEKGTYVWNSETGVIGSVPFVDTNGETGLSHPRAEENLRLLVQGDTLSVSTSEGNEQIARSAEPANSILGPWINGNPEDKDFLCVYFWENGDSDYFMVGEQIDPDNIDEGEDASSGIERGTYQWNPDTGAFSANVIVDTNGEYGVSSLDGLSGVTFLVDDGTLTVSIDGEDEQTVFRRPSTVAEKTVDRSIEGSWHLGLASTLAFLDGNLYFNSTNLSSSDNPLSGVERGTYTYDLETLEFTATAAIDTNSTAGMANTGLEARMGVHDDRLYRWLEDGRIFEYTRIKSQAKEYLGTWSFGNPAEDGSGVITFFDNSMIQNPNVSGAYILSEDSEEEEGPSSDGTELGLYTIDPVSKRLSVYFTPIDTSPDSGLGDVGINSAIRVWAMGTKLLLAERADGNTNYLVLDRVSEAPTHPNGLVLAPIDSEKWAILYRGALQKTPDLSANDWSDVSPQPSSPWIISPAEIPKFLRSRSE